MRSLTLKISPLDKKQGTRKLEIYRWRNGKMVQKPVSEETLPQGVFTGKLDPSTLSRLIREIDEDSGKFRETGTNLYAAIHVGSVAKVWDAERDLAQEEIEKWEMHHNEGDARPGGLRVYLSVEDEELAKIPWELMVSDFPLFLQEEWPILRLRSRVQPRDESAVWPIRLSVIVGCSEEQATEIYAKQELEGIRAAVRSADYFFDLDVVETRKYDNFTPDTLLGHLQRFRPHIFHFIGHGHMIGTDASLEINDRSGGRDWTASQIGLAVKSMRGVLRLAYVNACQSAVGLNAMSVAEAFFKGGALSVIAMQADVSGEAAQILSREFYSQIASGLNVDSALAAARHKVQDKLGPEKRHPYVPVFSVRADPEQILIWPASQHRRIMPPHIDDVRKQFVDRVKERRQAINTLFESGLGHERRSAVVVRGAEKIGKTWFLKWVLHACARNGTVIRHLEAFQHSDFLQLIYAVCDGSKQGNSFSEPLSEKVRAGFYNALADVAGCKIREGTKPAISLTDLQKRNDWQDKLLNAFHQSLKEEAGNEVFILAIDKWREGDRGLPESHFRSLKWYLWDRIAREPSGPVKILISLPGKENDRYEVDFPKDLWKTIDLDRFPAIEVPDLLRELFCLKYPDQLNAKIEQYIEDPNFEPLTPEELSISCDLLRKKYAVR
jgi:hypothetical protein